MKLYKGFVVMPEGFGALGEVLVVLDLIQTKEIGKFTNTLVVLSFWSRLHG